MPNAKRLREVNLKPNSEKFDSGTHPNIQKCYSVNV